MCGDDVNAAGALYGDNDFAAQLNEFRYDTNAEVVRNMYNGLYYALYYTNLVTDHFQYGTSDIKDRVISESRVIRAYIHMMLALGWGTPPLVDHVLAGDANPYNCNTDPNLGGMDQAGLLKWCAKECEESLEYLDERQGPGDKDGAVKDALVKGAGSSKDALPVVTIVDGFGNISFLSSGYIIGIGERLLRDFQK